MNILEVDGTKIRKLREETGCSLVQIANKAGISISFLSEVERNTKKPSLKTVEKLANTLGVPVTRLIVIDYNNGIISLGEKIKIARENKKMSLKLLAEKTGFNVSYLSNIEKGTALPSIASTRIIAKVLGVSANSLMGVSVSTAEKIKKIRNKTDVTQGELASRVGVSPSMIGQIENNKVQPSLKTLEKIADYFCISPCHLILDEVDVDDILLQMDSELKEYLSNPEVRDVLEAINGCSKKELNFIVEMIKLYKEQHNC